MKKSEVTCVGLVRSLSRNDYMLNFGPFVNRKPCGEKPLPACFSGQKESPFPS
jgi:hypothetical protein